MSKASGVPAIERVVGSLLIRRWCHKNPPERTLEIIRVQRSAMLELVERSPAKATTPVQIKRLRGLEHSSTRYSLAMVIQHVGLVNRDLAALLESLASGRAWDRVVRTADYKPSPTVTLSDSLALLDESEARLGAVLTRPDAIRDSRIAHVHPWFGELPAATWACFPSFHGALHLKQADLISAGLT